MKIGLGFSSCPNDTFIFHAMLHGCVNTGKYAFEPFISDVEELNSIALKGGREVTKLSFHAWLLLKDRYRLLNSGAALGYGCGPLVIARENIELSRDTKIAIPGEYTTAYMLLKLWKPGLENVAATRFDNILEGVRSGEFDAGVIIHEGRFVYPEYNLTRIVDLGEWWEQETGLPIPLGCIAARSDLHEDTIQSINSILRSSVEYALANRQVSEEYVRSWAVEMDKDVIQSHIDLYVNDFTVDLGTKGREAVSALEEMARSRGIIR
ncbi:MAG: 1,4-dihydroxy-6-naphthoate synthase [bacterium]|nr:1,4-dihydroxy-6-naphthoate synthase [bacterium]